MKNTARISYSLMLLMLSFGSVWAEENEATEKKKVISRSFDVSSKNSLLIDNQFGKVSINLWDKNEIKVDITITTNSNSEERAQKRIDGIQIAEKKTGEQISFRTEVNDEGHSGWWATDKGKNTIQIDYVVSMPSNVSLSVKNRFGNTSIPMFKAPLIVESKYGSFSANELTGSKNEIDVSFGKANIQQIDNARMEIAYSTLDLERANVLYLVNKFGKFKIGNVEKIDGVVSYSGNSSIGSVKNACKLKLSFSSGFKIIQIPSSADDVDINASYSSVSLPMENSDCDFDVKVSYGGFAYSTNKKVTFTQNDDNNKDGQGPRFTKHYIGKMGTGSGTRVRIVSNFGEVSIK